MYAASRKKPLRQMLLAFSLGALSVTGTSIIQAAPTVQTTQAPGYYRQAVGDSTVTALYDGYVDLKPAQLKGLVSKDIEALLARMFQKIDPGFQTAVNAYLIHTGSNLILIDAGAAKCFGPTLGNIVQNIEAAGYQPADVDTVLVTHMHPDHLCGVSSAEGKAVFPNATLWASQGDADFWLSEKVAAAAPEGAKPMYKMAQDAVAPYKAADKFRTFKNADALVPGLSVVPTPGHTPGHTSFLLESKGQNLLIWGDIVHSSAVQMSHPEVSIEFDVDSAQAIKTRKELMEQVASNGWWVAGAHMPFPGIGHLRKEPQGYTWVPAEYGPLR